MSGLPKNVSLSLSPSLSLSLSLSLSRALSLPPSLYLSPSLLYTCKIAAANKSMHYVTMYDTTHSPCHPRHCRERVVMKSKYGQTASLLEKVRWRSCSAMLLVYIETLTRVGKHTITIIFVCCVLAVDAKREHI